MEYMATVVMQPAASFARTRYVTEQRAPALTVVWRDTLEISVINVSFLHLLTVQFVHSRAPLHQEFKKIYIYACTF